jgi:glycogen(starch) synthase
LTDRLRLLVLTNNYPPHALGGYELICAQHVAWLRERGHEVTVLTSTFGLNGPPPAGELGAAGEPIIRALDFHWANFAHRRPRGLALVRGERRQRLVVEGLLDRARPQVVVAWGMACVSKSVLAVVHARGVPVVTMVEEAWPLWDIEEDAWLKLCRGLPRPLRGVAAVVAPPEVDAAMRAITPLFVSDYLRTQVEEGTPAWRGRGTVHPNGIDREASERARPAGAPLRSPLRLLYAGRVEERKGVRTAVSGLVELRSRGVAAQLTVVGWQDRALVDDLRRAAAAAGAEDALTFSEPVAREALPDVYLEHDILLFPTIWPEPFGLVPLEAMATGCLVVATATGGSGEYLHDGITALVFPPEDHVALADCVARLLADPALVATLRAGGRTTVADHDFERFAAGLEAAAVAAADVRTAG